MRDTFKSRAISRINAMRSVFGAFLVVSILGSFTIAPVSFADEIIPALPVKCTGTITDYTVVNISLAQIPTGGNDFIFAGDSNAIAINGGGGTDCILVGNGNTANISGSGGDDVITIGSNNSGEIKGKGGNDTIIVGENNIGNISGEGGNDILVDGYGSIIDGINGGGGIDTIVHVPPAPSSNPLPGTFNSSQNITLSSVGAESIRYTTNGTIPVCSPSATGTLYASPVLISSTKTITAVGCSGGYASPVASLSYTIELKTNPAGLSSVLETVFVPASGASLSLTSSLTVSQDLEINTTASGSKIILNETTVITRFDGQDFSAASLSSSETSVASLSGVTVGKVFEGALQWGIPNITLQFNPSITINIFVGAISNGKTLNVNRSVTGTGDWTTDGIVSPATCVVSGGLCSFQATKASVYAAITEPPASTPEPTSSPVSSGGGSGWFPQLYNPDPRPSGINSVEPTKKEEIVLEPNISPIPPAPTPMATITPNLAPTPKPKAFPKIVKALPTIISTPTPIAQNQPVELVSQPSLRKATILGTIGHAITLSIEKIRILFFTLIRIKT